MAFPQLTTNIWCDIIFRDSYEGVASMAFRHVVDQHSGFRPGSLSFARLMLAPAMHDLFSFDPCMALCCDGSFFMSIIGSPPAK